MYVDVVDDVDDDDDDDDDVSECMMMIFDRYGGAVS